MLQIHFLSSILPTLTQRNSEIPHDRRAPPQHGHDGLLPNDGAATHLTPSQHVEVRPCRQEAGPVSRAEAREELSRSTLYNVICQGEFSGTGLRKLAFLSSRVDGGHGRL